MAYIAGLIIATLFFMVLHYFTELSYKQKVLVTAVMALVIGSAYAYNRMSSQERDQIAAVELKYAQDKTLHCKGVDVNKTNFSFSVGTHTFLGRKDTPYYKQMINARECQ